MQLSVLAELDVVERWLQSLPVTLVWEQAAAVVAVLLAIWLLLRRRAALGPCAACRTGSRLEGLTYIGCDGKEIGVRCQTCKSYYARDLANAQVTPVNRAYARAHWLTVFTR